jgi:hypothetical protein
VTALEAAILLHVLLFVYWLGADLGVFYSSRWVLRESASPEARGVALKIMHFLDLSPRLALVLFLPSGVTLMALDDYGRDVFAGWPLLAVWVAGLAWLALVVLDYEVPGFRYAALVKRLDLLARGAVVVGLLGAAVYTVVATEPFGVTTNPRWLGVKVGCYALAIGAGILIRRQLTGFGPAWVELQTSGSTPDVERRLRHAVDGSIPYVAAIWVLVLAAAALGIAKPGAVL